MQIQTVRSPDSTFLAKTKASQLNAPIPAKAYLTCLSGIPRS